MIAFTEKLLALSLRISIVLSLSFSMLSCQSGRQNEPSRNYQVPQEKDIAKLLPKVEKNIADDIFFTSIYTDGDFSLFAVQLNDNKADMHTIVRGVSSFCVDRRSNTLYWNKNDKIYLASYDRKTLALQNKRTIIIEETNAIADIACNEDDLLAYLTISKSSQEYFIKLYDTKNLSHIKEIGIKTDLNHSIYFISVSPDGKYLGYSMYESEDGHPTGGESELWIFDLQKETTKRIGTGSQHRWSRDGNYIYALKGDYFAGDSIVKYDLGDATHLEIKFRLMSLQAFTHLDDGLLLSVNHGYNLKTGEVYLIFGLIDDTGKVLKTYQSNDIVEIMDAAVIIK